MDGRGADVNRLRATTQNLREKCVRELGDERRWNNLKRLLKAERAEKGTRCAQHSQEQGRGHPTPSTPAPRPADSPLEAQPQEDAGPSTVDTGSVARQESTRPQSRHPHNICTLSSPQSRPTVSKVPFPSGGSSSGQDPWPLSPLMGGRLRNCSIFL